MLSRCFTTVIRPFSASKSSTFKFFDKRFMSTVDSKQFIDYFGSGSLASNYAKNRPAYPQSFIDQPPKNILDIGCGTGQATLFLAKHGDRVVGMDPSQGQVDEAKIAAEVRNLSGKVTFFKGVAEDLSPAGFDEASIDLITAAQCAHWFDLPKFWTESKKFLSSDGVCAIWCYTRPTVSSHPNIESSFEHLYSETLGPYWPSSRKMVDGKYAHIIPDYPTVDRIDTSMEYKLTGPELVAYIKTWSSYQVAVKSKPEFDFLKEFVDELKKMPQDTIYDIVTPIHLIVAKK